jgi:hypothetical protein
MSRRFVTKKLTVSTRKKQKGPEFSLRPFSFLQQSENYLWKALAFFAAQSLSRLA